MTSRRTHSVGVAESLTGGLLSSRLAEREAASEWFAGGVVSYTTRVKRDVLGVEADAVVSEAAALDMAEGVRRLLSVDVAVAVTGVGGPDDQDGVAPGTVWVAVTGPGRRITQLHQFPGEPEQVCHQTVQAALDILDGLLSDLENAPNGARTTQHR
jgi:nicotinamide-nucleotide amidase